MRSIGLPLAAKDQVRLCDVLASVHAVDAAAAAAYDHLAATFPDSLRSEHAWLYCRAAQTLAFAGQSDLMLLGRTIREEPAARSFYTERGWDFDDVEYTFLYRCASQRPGSFPPEMGPDYPSHAQTFLLDRSRKQQEANDRNAALASADVLVKLAPRYVPGIDWLAHLCYHLGNLERAATVLADWHTIDPTDPVPLMRRAVIEQVRGNGAAAGEAIDRALTLVQGKQRAAVAFLGTRLALQEAENGDTLLGESEPAALARLVTTLAYAAGSDSCPEPGSKVSPFSPGGPGVARRALALLGDCLTADPDHVDALWVLAAVLAKTGDRQGLKELAPAMNRLDVTDPAFTTWRLFATWRQASLRMLCKPVSVPPQALSPTMVAVWSWVPRATISPAVPISACRMLRTRLPPCERLPTRRTVLPRTMPGHCLDEFTSQPAPMTKRSAGGTRSMLRSWR